MVGNDLKARCYVGETTQSTNATTSTGNPVAGSSPGSSNPALIYTSQALRASANAVFRVNLFCVTRTTAQRAVVVRYIKQLRTIP